MLNHFHPKSAVSLKVILFIIYLLIYLFMYLFILGKPSCQESGNTPKFKLSCLPLLLPYDWTLRRGWWWWRSRSRHGGWRTAGWGHMGTFHPPSPPRCPPPDRVGQTHTRHPITASTSIINTEHFKKSITCTDAERTEWTDGPVI